MILIQITPMMTPDWSVEIVGGECNSIEYCIHFNIFLKGYGNIFLFWLIDKNL